MSVIDPTCRSDPSLLPACRAMIRISSMHIWHMLYQQAGRRFHPSGDAVPTPLARDSLEDDSKWMPAQSRSWGLMDK